MRIIPALLLASAALLGACKKDTPVHTFEPAALERSGGPDCASDGSRCAHLALGYPLAGGPLAQAINDSISSTITGILLMLNPDGEESTDISRLADQFVASYEEFLREAPDYEMGWMMESVYEIHRNTSEIVSIELMINSFTGGAHPIGFSQTLNFYLPEGRYLAWENLINDRDAFLLIVEQEFKRAWDLPETASLQEEGFFWDKQVFLPNNFAFTDQGLYLIYNVYEAAPYALGPTEFHIPYEKVKAFFQISF